MRPGRHRRRSPHHRPSRPDGLPANDRPHLALLIASLESTRCVLKPAGESSSLRGANPPNSAHKKIEVVAPSARRRLTASVTQPLPRRIAVEKFHNTEELSRQSAFRQDTPPKGMRFSVCSWTNMPAEPRIQAVPAVPGP